MHTYGFPLFPILVTVSDLSSIAIRENLPSSCCVDDDVPSDCADGDTGPSLGGDLCCCSTMGACCWGVWPAGVAGGLAPLPVLLKKNEVNYNIQLNSLLKPILKGT